MTEKTVKLSIPFDALVSSVVRLSLDEKRKLWEVLDVQIAQAEEERWERDPSLQQEVREARAAYAAGDYVTTEECADRPPEADIEKTNVVPTVTIEPELYRRVAEAAQKEKTGVEQVLHMALRRYLWELARRKIGEESTIYRRRHAELKKQYLGEYIAMVDGEVVDHDRDFQALRQRVSQRYGRTPVMMTLVEDEPETLLTRHGFRLQANDA